MFILTSDIPRELYNKLIIVEEDLDTLTMCSNQDTTHFTKYEGKHYIVTNSWDDLVNYIKDTQISVIITNSSYFPYPTINFIVED